MIIDINYTTNNQKVCLVNIVNAVKNLQGCPVGNFL